VLAIRPTGVRLAPLASGTHHLIGRVSDVAFRGRGYEYAIDLPDQGRLTGVFARHRAARGEEVGLLLEPDGCHLFPADAADTSEGGVTGGAAGKDADSPARALTA
jgi:hypothetical protein